MGTRRWQIEHLEYQGLMLALREYEEIDVWKVHSHSRIFLKKMMNRYIRRQPIKDDDVGYKRRRKPYKSREY